jgi:hypothetical protein
MEEIFDEYMGKLLDPVLAESSEDQFSLNHIVKGVIMRDLENQDNEMNDNEDLEFGVKMEKRVEEELLRSGLKLIL